MAVSTAAWPEARNAHLADLRRMKGLSREGPVPPIGQVAAANRGEMDLYKML